MSVLRLAREEVKREKVLCHVGWLVLLLARKEVKREKVLCHVGWLVLLLASEGSEKRARNG